MTRIETIVGGAEFAAQLLDAARAEIRWDDQEAFLITSGEIEAFVIWEHLEGPILDLVVLLDSLCLEKLGPKRCWVRPGRNQPAPWAGGRS